MPKWGKSAMTGDAAFIGPALFLFPLLEERSVQNFLDNIQNCDKNKLEKIIKKQCMNTFLEGTIGSPPSEQEIMSSSLDPNVEKLFDAIEINGHYDPVELCRDLLRLEPVWPYNRLFEYRTTPKSIKLKLQ